MQPQSRPPICTIVSSMSAEKEREGSHIDASVLYAASNTLDDKGSRKAK